MVERALSYPIFRENHFDSYDRFRVRVEDLTEQLSGDNRAPDRRTRCTLGYDVYLSRYDGVVDDTEY